MLFIFTYYRVCQFFGNTAIIVVVIFTIHCAVILKNGLGQLDYDVNTRINNKHFSMYNYFAFVTIILLMGSSSGSHEGSLISAGLCRQMEM